MNKLILSAAMATALFAAGGAIAQEESPPGTVLGLEFNGERYVYRGPDRSDSHRYQENWRERDRNWERDRDRERDRARAGRDRDGDGVRNNRDRYPNDPRYR